MLVILILIYCKQDQFLTTIVFFYLPTAIQLWNGLPLEIKCIQTLHPFSNVFTKPV